MPRLLLSFKGKHEPRRINRRWFYLCGVFTEKYQARWWALGKKSLRGYRFRVFRLDTIQHIKYSKETEEGLYNFGVWLHKEEKP